MKTAYPELRMPERAKLIEQLSVKCEVELVDAASAACLWLADTERLETLIRKADDDEFAFVLRKLLDGTLGDSVAAVFLRAWAGRGRSAAARKKLDTGVEQAVYSETEDKHTRSLDAKRLCKERDNDMCLITRASVPVEVAHIFPALALSGAGEAHEDFDSDHDDEVEGQEDIVVGQEEEQEEEEEREGALKKKQNTYNRKDSLVVTHPTTNLPACGLSTAERTGSPIFHTLWSQQWLKKNRNTKAVLGTSTYVWQMSTRAAAVRKREEI
ncbi:hypothetical protein CBS147344_5560 [Aspergillus niger]|nr:hypothetical protein CBS147344_5560 [Aspergillus niger]